MTKFHKNTIKIRTVIIDYNAYNNSDSNLLLNIDLKYNN